jgi:predicted nuclease with TOPRIM domain
LSKNTRNYPKKDVQELNSNIQKLKSQIRNLKKENRELASENKTLLDAWVKTADYLHEVTDGIPLEEILRTKDRLPKDLVHKHTSTRKPKEDFTRTELKEEARKKWAKWNEQRKSKTND